MKKTSLAGFLVAFVVLFIAVIGAYAAPVGKITRIEGRVDVLKEGQRVVRNVSLGDSVDVGDIYRAKTNSRAEITFFNKNIIRIAPATRMQVSQYSDDGTKSNQIMKLERGKVQAVSSEEFVKKVSSFAEGNRFEVQTPNAVAGIRGSGMTVGFAQMVTGLFFSTGKGYFYNPRAPGRVVNVAAGFVSFVVGTGGAPSRPVRGNVSYVGGTGEAPPGTGGSGGGGNTSGSGLNIEAANVTSVVNTGYTFTPPPVIPNVFVGSVESLSGTYHDPLETVNISLNKVKFYGPTATGIPQSWEADSVTGTYTSVGEGNTFQGMALSGGGVTANFILTSDIETSSDAGNWTANIASGKAPEGVGTCKTAFTFSGTAAGTWSGQLVNDTHVGTISGTASGEAPSVLTQDPVAAPNTVVGSIASLSGFAGTTTWMEVQLNNVKFYGSSATAKPQIWQAGSVSGTSSPGGLPAFVNVDIPLQSGANSAVFTVYSADGSNWKASVNSGSAPGGVGGYTGAVTFSGSANGTNTSTTLNGAASGKVH
ncbi:MAG: FecR domain-containing protein [Syntrophorhabdaceae bacterium]|nr:FecR domain-containing protein [Syntrophorhabdaceae bacterium]